ncbi:hypothetical protein [Roseivirga pacifica]|uniref:hypothetical protein n=1 Tax=Roseivirga pacifica TaxID=1267423 RepID=UPI003BABBBD5
MKIKSRADFEKLRLIVNDDSFNDSELVITGSFREENYSMMDIVIEGFREDILYVFMDFQCKSLIFNQKVRGVEFRSSIVVTDGVIVVENLELDKVNIALGIGSSKGLEFYIIDSNIQEMNIRGAGEIMSITITSCFVLKLLAENSEIGSLNFNGKSGKCEIVDAVVHANKVEVINTEGDCVFGKMRIQDFMCRSANLSNSVVDYLYFNRVRPELKRFFWAPKNVTTFEAESFNIGEMASSQLQPLLAASRVILHSISGIKEIKGDVIWPRKLYGQAQENQAVYRDIKERSTEKSKYDLASFYKRMELLSHFQHQKSIERKWYNKLELIFTMGLPYFASRFGTKLLRPIFLLLCFHLLLSIIMVGVSGQQYGLEFTGYFTWSSFFESLELYFYTILPTHRISYNGASLNTVVSFFMRLSSGIFIYHIILTSRRHLE